MGEGAGFVFRNLGFYFTYIIGNLILLWGSLSCNAEVPLNVYMTHFQTNTTYIAMLVDFVL